MSYRALYRVWRPRFFYELKGQEHIAKVLKNQVAMGRVAHAYLFSGPRGTGKTSAAKILARAVNCTASEGGEPCGKCAQCLESLAETSLDIIEIDAASNNGVENIRDLREKVNLLPTLGRYKVYIVDEVHMLSAGAFNALLKTLEEPPPHVIFILATTEPRKLPATILSRCQRYDFRRISSADIAERLKQIAGEERLTAEDGALMLIAQASEGATRDAVSLLDQAGSMEGGATLANVSELLGGAGRKSLFDLARHISNFDIKNALLAFGELKSAGSDLGVLQKDLTGILRDMLVLAFYGGAYYYEDKDELKAMGERMGQDALQRALEILLKCEQDMRYHSQPDIVLQTALIRAMTPEDGPGDDAVRARLNKLESIVEQFKEGFMQQPPAPRERPVQKQPRPAAEAPRPEKKAPPAVHTDAELKAAWDKIINLIGKTARTLYEPAHRMRIDGMSEDTIRLCCAAKDADAASLLEIDTAKEAIRRASAQCLGREMSVKITVDREDDGDGEWMESFGPDVEIIDE